MGSPEGILLVDKPQGYTSHDVVARVRRIFGIKKVGHAGTLDPLATGLLVVLLGKATKLSAKLTEHDKEYLIGVEFGKRTDTADADGKVVYELPPYDRKLLLLGRERLQASLEKLKGRIKQRVPAYSAVKVGGKKLYEQARKGKRVERPVREVEVKELRLKEFKAGSERSYPRAVLRAVVSAGTYTRALIEDIDRLLGIPAHQKTLRRVRSGRFSVEEAITLPELERAKNPASLVRLQPVDNN